MHAFSIFPSRVTGLTPEAGNIIKKYIIKIMYVKKIHIFFIH
jgi:hypothetical protein